MDKCKYDELVYMHMHVHTHYVCHTPSNYNIVTNRQAELTVKPDHWQRYRNIVTDFHTISRYKKKTKKTPKFKPYTQECSLFTDVLCMHCTQIQKM